MYVCMCLLPKEMEEGPFTVSAGGQTYQRTDRFVYLGRTITADGKADKEIVHRICRAWQCSRRHSEAMYDRRRVDLRRLKAQLLLQAEVVKTLLYGCASISEPDGGPLHEAQRGAPPAPRPVHWLEQPEAHGPPPVLRRDPSFSRTGCEETTEATVRKRQ